MVEEVTIRSGKTLRVGDSDWQIVEKDVAPVVPSVFLEARQFNGLVYISLAQTVVDAGNQPEAWVCARLRMDLGFAQSLRDQLTSLIEDALTPSDKSKAN
ncbi:hypothetical protein ACG873_30320 [Mesorhizobium sp. AaZ16]|uniref:hypothetical protein n=1 Tax=Mesorhizobium sp. AaZ16 TaxID=3402289 RepID=UPI00374E32C4